MTTGTLDYIKFINIFTTTEDVKHTFPRDQYKYTYDFAGAGANGWASTLTWMTLIVDSVGFDSAKKPDFTNSVVTGYFVGGSASQGSSGTMTFPANMYSGPILPGFERNIPVTTILITWTKGTQQVQKQLLLIQNWEPGTTIGDPTLDDNYIPIQGVSSNLELFLESGPVLFGEPFSLSAVTDIPTEVAELGLARFYIQQTGDDRYIGEAPFVGQVATLTTATDYGTGDPRNITSGTYVVYAVRPGRREYVASTSNTQTQIIFQGVPLVVNVSESPDPITVTGAILNLLNVTVTATTASGYYLETGPINSTSTVTLIPNTRTAATSATIVKRFADGIFTATFALTDVWIDSALTTASNYTITTSSYNDNVFTATAIVSTVHTDRVTWDYNRGSKLTGGTTSSTFTAVGTKDYTTTRKPITVVAQEQIGNGITFSSTVSTHQTYNKNSPVLTFKISATNTSSIANAGTATFTALYTSTYEIAEFAQGQTTQWTTLILDNSYAWEQVLYQNRYKVKDASGIRIGSTFTYNGSNGNVNTVNTVSNYIEVNFSTSTRLTGSITFTNPSSYIEIPPSEASTASYRIIGFPNSNEIRFDYLPEDLTTYSTFELDSRTWPILSITTSTNTLKTNNWSGLVDIENYIDYPVSFTLNLVDDGFYNNPYALVYIAGSQFEYRSSPQRGDGLRLDYITGSIPYQWPVSAEGDRQRIKFNKIPKDVKVGDYFVILNPNGSYKRWPVNDLNRNDNVITTDKMFYAEYGTYSAPAVGTVEVVRVQCVNGGFGYSGSNITAYKARSGPGAGSWFAATSSQGDLPGYFVPIGSLNFNQLVGFYKNNNFDSLGFTTSTDYQSLTLGSVSTATFNGSSVEWLLNPSNLNTGTYYVSGAINTELSKWNFASIPKNSTSATWKLIISEPTDAKMYGVMHGTTSSMTLTVYNYSKETFSTTVEFFEGTTSLGSSNWTKTGYEQKATLTLGPNSIHTASIVSAVWPGSISLYRVSIDQNKYSTSTTAFVTSYDIGMTSTIAINGSTSTNNISYGGNFTATVNISKINQDPYDVADIGGNIYLISTVNNDVTKYLAGAPVNSPNVFSYSNFEPNPAMYNDFFTATISTIYSGDANHYANRVSKNINVYPGTPSDIPFISYSNKPDPLTYPYFNGQSYVLTKLGDYMMNSNSGNCTLQVNFKIIYKGDIGLFSSQYAGPGQERPYTLYPYVAGSSASTTSTFTAPYIVQDSQGYVLFPGILGTPTAISGLTNQSFSITATGSGGGINQTWLVSGTLTYTCYYIASSSVTVPIYIMISTPQSGSYYSSESNNGWISSSITNGAAVSTESSQATSQNGVNKFTPVSYLPPL